jgi:hypothetical protein
MVVGEFEAFILVLFIVCVRGLVDFVHVAVDIAGLFHVGAFGLAGVDFLGLAGISVSGLNIAFFTRFYGLVLARISSPNLFGTENSESIGVDVIVLDPVDLDVVAVLDIINLDVAVDSGFRSVAEGRDRRDGCEQATWSARGYQAGRYPYNRRQWCSNHASVPGERAHAR